MAHSKKLKQGFNCDFGRVLEQRREDKLNFSGEKQENFAILTKV